MAEQKFDPAKTPGSFDAPPADAPVQVTIAGSERATPEQIALARANEQDLPTYAPKPMTREQMEAYLGKDRVNALLGSPTSAPAAAAAPKIIITDAQEPKPVANSPHTTSSVKPVDQPLPSTSRLRRVLRPIVEQLTGGAVVDAVPDHASAERAHRLALETGNALAHAAAIQAAVDAGEMPMPSPATDADAAAHAQGELAPAQPWQPAASDTDTPSRGLPHPIADQGKQITGGFGLAMDAQYFPLDGNELREAIYAMFGRLHDQLKDDLRFTLAVTYPRVTARVIVEVQAYATDQSYQIPRVALDHKQTPLEIAAAHADEVCFVVLSSIEEMTADGQSVLPPDKIRKELGIKGPRKQKIDLPGGGQSFVDIPS